MDLHKASILIALTVLLAGQISMPSTVQEKQTLTSIQTGDWAKYSIEATWQSNFPGMVEPPYYQQLRNIEWLKTEIEEISGANASMSLITHFRNGTEIAEMLVGNVESGDGNLSLLFPLPTTPLIVKANLTVGDRIPELIANISKTCSRIYAGYHRDENCVEWNASGIGTNTGLYYYFDEVTGFLCEFLATNSISLMGYSISYSISVKIIEASMFTDQIHNLGIKNLVLSPAQLYIGSELNVTISIKNEGTETETFNITAYWNSTEIWRTQITNLPGGESKNVWFAWNTTGLSVGTYVVKAVAYLQDDTDATDNTYVHDSLYLQHVPPPISDILYVAIGAGTTITAVAVLYVRRRRTYNVKNATGLVTSDIQNQ